MEEILRQTIATPIEKAIDSFDEATDEFKPTTHDDKVLDFLDAITKEDYVPVAMNEIAGPTHVLTIIMYKKLSPIAKPLQV